MPTVTIYVDDGYMKRMYKLTDNPAAFCAEAVRKAIDDAAVKETQR